MRKWKAPHSTLFLRRLKIADEFFCCAGAYPSSLQQSLQRTVLPGLMLAGQAGAAARSVHSTSLSFAEGARHAAAAARLPQALRAVLRQRFALLQRSGVARFTSDHRPHRTGEPGERSQRDGETKRAETGHYSD